MSDGINHAQGKRTYGPDGYPVERNSVTYERTTLSPEPYQFHDGDGWQIGRLVLYRGQTISPFGVGSVSSYVLFQITMDLPAPPVFVERERLQVYPVSKIEEPTK